MADQSFNDFVPPEMRKFAEQSVQQAKKAFDDLMTATQRAVSTFEGHASSAQTAAARAPAQGDRLFRAQCRRILGVRPEACCRRRTPEDAMKLHADYVKAQMQALTEQARDIAQHAAKAATPPGRTDSRLAVALGRGQLRHSLTAFLCIAILILQCSITCLYWRSRVAYDQRVCAADESPPDRRRGGRSRKSGAASKATQEIAKEDHHHV